MQQDQFNQTKRRRRSSAYKIEGTNGYKIGCVARDEIEQRMTPGQIIIAQRLAREWMGKHGEE